jgi:hypothetical protein
MDLQASSSGTPSKLIGEFSFSMIRGSLPFSDRPVCAKADEFMQLSRI